jgi:hypothetical protein
MTPADLALLMQLLAKLPTLTADALAVAAAIEHGKGGVSKVQAGAAALTQLASDAAGVAVTVGPAGSAAANVGATVEALAPIAGQAVATVASSVDPNAIAHHDVTQLGVNG